MTEIHVLPGVERRDLGEPVPSEEVLSAAIEKGVIDVCVIGRDRAGDLYVAAALEDPDRVVGLLMRAVQMLSSCTMERTAPINLPKEPA